MKFFYYPTILALLIIGCDSKNTSQQTIKDDFSSPKNLFVDYISSHTEGVISKSGDVRLRLAKPIPDSLIGTVVEDVFSFSPEIAGTTSWINNRTVSFLPSNELSSGEQYKVTTNLSRLIPGIKGDRETFKFVFQTLVQNYELSVTGIRLYDANELGDIRVEGSIQTADVIDLVNLEKALKATQSGNNLETTITASEMANTFDFVVEHAKRLDNESQVDISIEGSMIGVDKKETKEVKIPALGDYSILSSQIVRGKENYVSVTFSDPLDPRQNVLGLVSLGSSSQPRAVVNLNELKVYPTQEMEGSAVLKIFAGIRNVAGFKLKEDYQTTLQFNQMKPEVRFIDVDRKAILPNSKGILLPFESVGLKAVDVTIIKVFEDNILQYLQVNSLGGNSQLNRVGRPVARKTIHLNNSGVTNLNNWNRFTLDLEDILTTEPGVIYQIKIGFKKQHSLYFCADQENIDSEVESLENWDSEEEASYWDSYDSYYYEDYDWSERDNPCSNSYYGSRRSISKMMMASDLGIISKKGDKGSIHVFLTNLITTKPISGASIEVYDYQQQLLTEAKTDSEGKAIINAKGTPFILIAQKESQIGYLKMDDGSSLSLSNFNVTGTRIQKGLKGFIYGERGVWRPADTVHLAFMLEDEMQTLPENHPVIMELYNPDNQLMSRKISSQAVGNIYRFDFVTESDAPTGNWTAKVKVGGALFGKLVRIETIKPNRLKINLEFDKDIFTASDDRVSGDLNVRWLSGATGGNMKVQYEVLMKPVKTTFDDYPNFFFDDESKDFDRSREPVFEGRTNEDGYAKLNLDLGDVKGAPGALMVNLYGKVFEEGGNFSISSSAIPYFPYTSFVGVKAPEGDKRGMLLTDQDHEIMIATVDADGNPISRKGIEVALYKVNWRWWWDNSYDYISNYVGSNYRDPIAIGQVNTTNGNGVWKLRVNQPSWGRYYLQVKDPISGHSAGQVIYLDWPGWAGKGKRGDLDGASMLDFAVEKEAYKVGEKMVLSIPSTANNRILVSLETGSEVLQTFWVATEENTTNISIEATSEMAPNIYAHLTMIQPHGQSSNDLPIRLYGVQSVKVVDPGTTLEPVIQMPDELRPEQQFTIEVSEKSRKAMSYTIAVVDEGLLDITNYKTPDPWSSFYAREALGIKTWDVYDDVMGAYSGQIEHLLAIGGDGELKPKEEKEANRFKPVVKYLGPFYLESGAKASHTIKMPQYIGSVKTMVVAAADGAYGSADVVTPVKQPLMILASLPRVAGPGERMKLPVNVFAMQDNIRDVSVSVSVNGTLKLNGPATKTVKFDKSGDQVVYFDVLAKENIGVGTVKVIAKSGSMQAVYDIDMNVIPRNPVTTDISEKVVNAGGHWSITYQPIGLLGKNEASVEISSLPPLNIEQRLGYLIRYPHGCIEQTTSAVFPQLFLSQLMNLTEERKGQIQRNVEAGIKRLKSFQVGSGGFTYWPGSDYPNNWGSNYAGHFLLEAAKAGYAVPEGMLNNWLGFQNAKAENWGALSSSEDNDLIQAYRLYTLALAGKAALGAMNRMKESGKVRREAKWRLALAYSVAGYQKQALDLVQGLSVSADSTVRDYRYSFGSNTRDQAMILETLLSLEQKEQAFQLLMDIAKKMGDKNRWMSTQTTAYCFIGIAKYAATFKTDSETNVIVKEAAETQNYSGIEYVYQHSLNNPDQEVPLDITNAGESPVFVRLIREGIPLEGKESSIKRNIEFSVTYEDLKGNPVNITSLKQGTSFKAIVSVVNPGLRGTYNELALTQIFPSGWEITNTRLDGSVTEGQFADYLDIRDDRTMHYFDLRPNQKADFEVLLNATYQGKFYLPSVSIEAMYDNAIFANKPGMWIEVIPE